MAESAREEPAQRLRREPQILANIPPSIGQRRAACILVLALLAILAIAWPFATIKLPVVDAFVPTLAAALFVSDTVTAVLLLGQFSILRRWALLVITNGYVFPPSSSLRMLWLSRGHSRTAVYLAPVCDPPSGSIGSGMQDCRSRSSGMRCLKIGIIPSVPTRRDLQSARASQP